MRSSQARIVRLIGLMIAFILLPASPAVGLAQDATPSAGEVPHPAHIHSGTCMELGDVVYPLTDVAAPGDMMMGDATPASTPHDMGMMHASTPMAGGEVVAESTTEVEAALDDILAAEHAINVHESAENIGNYIACGDVTGTADNGELRIELQELNDSGYSGEATLVDNGDGTTTVTVRLMMSGTDGMSTPMASTGDEGSAMAAVEVVISDFAYAPNSITISVGDSVTFTNQDSAPHTATAQDRDILQTGTLNQGDSFTQTFDTPGTYEYFCEFHPDMVGTIIVE